ncbi:MAG: hypothetical protein ACE5IO_06140 [Thermoplasmata archaeon]
MGKFLESEKERLTTFKQESGYFSNDSLADGFYRTKYRPYCIPRERSSENLFADIRNSAVNYFTKYEIKWHDAINKKPSNHLCDSMVSCVNFLFPLADKPMALKELFRSLFPTIEEVLPMEREGLFLALEWIGEENYLGEKVAKHGKRTRGANFTSADAAVMFQRKNKKKQIVLIEWKNTESYSPTPLKISRSGTDRTKIYEHLFLREDFPLKKELLPSFDSLFYEPFYQFMRQRLLANEMEKARELDADIVSLLHIAPAMNKEFQRVTSPPLADLGETVIQIWKDLQRVPNRFHSISTEEMFSRFPIQDFPALDPWWDYITSRYSWFV